MIGVVKAAPLDLIQDLGSVSSGIEDFFYFPLLLLLDDNGRGWCLVLCGYGFCTGCGFEEADVEDWVDFDIGRQVQLIGASAYSLQDGVRAYLLVVQFVR